jgi:hypothetical protein
LASVGARIEMPALRLIAPSPIHRSPLKCATRTCSTTSPGQRDAGALAFVDFLHDAVDDVGLARGAHREVGARAGPFANVSVDDHRRPEARRAASERRPEQLLDGLFFFGRERRRPHDHQLAPFAGSDPRLARRERLFGVHPDRRQEAPADVARDEHVGYAADALQVDDPARAVFGHRHAAEADDVFAGAVDRDRRHDHGVGPADVEREGDRRERRRDEGRSPRGPAKASPRQRLSTHRESQDRCRRRG